MSLDIDMQSYAGASTDSAAGSQQVVDTNSYQEAQEFPVQTELLDADVKQEVNDPNINPQAEHFRALREEVDRIKAEKETERKEYQLQLDIFKANLAQQNVARQPEPPARKMFEGMDDSDVPNVKELRQEWAQREAGYQARLEELQVQQLHPDYAEVIEKYALPLVKQKPHLAEGIQGATNKALFAYELGKMAQQMQSNSTVSQQSSNAQRMVENSKKPGTLSQAGGQSVLGKADYIASMSDQEFMKYASRHLEGI